jgi:hypothetical protein
MAVPFDDPEGLDPRRLRSAGPAGALGDEAVAYTPRPAWVKWLLISLAVLALVVAVASLAGGNHGPGRHVSRAEARVDAGSSLDAIAVNSLGLVGR